VFRLEIAQDAELRLLTSHEAAALFALTEKNRAHLRQWLPWLDSNAGVEDTLRYVEDARERYSNREAIEVGLFHRGRLVGMAGLNTIDWAPRRGEMGYWLAADAQGQGLVTSACRALIQHAFIDYDLNRLEIRCATNNARSRAIPEKIGFVCEGVLRQVEWLYDHFVDHALYAQLRQDWQQSL
jgi:ribosomal-protein-serine acetyltransferase